MKTIKSFSAILLCISFSFIALSAKAGDPLEKWEKNNPDASRELGKWVSKHKDAAHYIFEWDGSHHEKAEALVKWAVKHPSENLAKFHRQHKDWPELDEIEKTHKRAFEEFLIWCKNYTDAANALMEHPNGLKWAGDHLWREAREMKEE